MRDKSESALIERHDRADAIEDSASAKLTISSYEMTACAKVRESIIGSARYARGIVVMAEDQAGIIVHHNGTPIRVRVEPLTGAEREAIVFGNQVSDRGQEAPDVAGPISSPPASPAAINSTVTA